VEPTTIQLGVHKETNASVQHYNTPAKDRVKADTTKEYKSPKRKAAHPRRRSNPIDSLPRIESCTPLRVNEEPTPPPPALDGTCVSPLLGKEDFTQMLKAMFSNSSFQEKIADNINKVALG